MDNPPPPRHATLTFTLYPFNLFNLFNPFNPMKRLSLLLPLLALAAAPVFALSLKPMPEEPYAAPTLPWREALAAADAAVGAATNGARCVILTWRQRDATWGAFYDAGDAFRSVTVDAEGRCVENAAEDPPWNSPAEFLSLAEAAAAAERASAGAVRTAALSRPDATWYVALSDDGTRKLVVVSPDGSVEPVPPPPEATDEERTANAGVVRVLPERAGDAWCVVAATNATALRGVRFAFLDAVKPTQTNLCFAVSGNGRWAAAAFRHGRGSDAGALPDGAAEAVARALGPDAARLLADPAKRVPCRFEVLDDVPSFHFEKCRLPDDFAPSGENVRFLVCRSTEKDASGGYRTKDDIHAIVHFDSVSFSRSRPGDRIDRVRVMCNDPETGLRRGVAWDCVRQDDGTWLEGPVEDEIIRLQNPATQSPAEESHAESAEGAEN